MAQGLDVVIDAAIHLRDHPNIHFVMIGDGPSKDDLMRTARSKNLENIHFLARRPKKQMPARTKVAEVVKLIIIVNNHKF